MTTLIIGGSGMLGQELVRTGADVAFTYATFTPHLDAPSYHCQIGKDDLGSLLKKVNPSRIIYAAALTDLARAEKEPHLAKEVNVDGVLSCKTYCEQGNIPFIYISTSYVFDGEKGDYTEEDATSPLSVYATTKRDGEIVALSFTSPTLVIRCNHIHFLRHGALRWPFTQLLSGAALVGYKGFTFSALYTKDLARLIWACVNMDLQGIYHLGSKDTVSRTESLKILATLSESPSPISEEIGDFPGRPKNPSLNLVHSTAAGLEFPTVGETLSHAVADFKEWCVSR